MFEKSSIKCSNKKPCKRSWPDKSNNLKNVINFNMGPANGLKTEEKMFNQVWVEI